MTTTHHTALEDLGFVHEFLPTGHDGAGKWFTTREDFDVRKFDHVPALRVVIDEEGTQIFGFDGFILAYAIRFTAETPSEIVRQAVSAARNNAR